MDERKYKSSSEEISEDESERDSSEEEQLPLFGYTERGGYLVYKWRWVVLLLFSCGTLQSSVFQFSFAPIANIVSDYYGISTGVVNLLTIVYLAAFPLLTFVTSATMSNLGLRWTVVLGACLEMLAGLIRLGGSFSPKYFWVLFLGQCVGAIGQPFIGLNVVTLLSENWFPMGRERALATTCSSLSAIVGGGVIFGLAPLVVRDGKQLWVLMALEAGAGVLVFLFIFALFKSRPSTPPSASAAEAEEGENTRKEAHKKTTLSILNTLYKQMWRDAEVAFSDLSYLLLYICYGVMYGVFTAYLTLANEILVPEGYDAEFSGMIGVITILTGVLGALLMGAYVGKSHKYKESFIVGVWLAFICFLGIVLTLQFIPSQGWLLFIESGLFGFFAMAMVPAALEAAVEFTHPVPPGTSTGFLNINGTTVAIVMILLMDALAGVGPLDHDTRATCVGQPGCVDKEMHLSLWIATLLWFLASFAPFFYSRDYKRLAFESMPAEVVDTGGPDNEDDKTDPTGMALSSKPNHKAILATGIEPLDSGESVIGWPANMKQMVYYSISIKNENLVEIYIEITFNGMPRTVPLVYVKSREVPDHHGSVQLNRYDDQTGRLTTAIQHPSANTVYYLGLIDFDEPLADYEISASHISSCECNGHGYCQSSMTSLPYCDCDIPYYGANCEKKAMPLVNSTIYSSSVRFDEFVYYSIMTTEYYLTVDITISELCDHCVSAIYVQKEKMPNLASFDFSKLDQLDIYTLTLSLLEINTVYYIGVMGVTNVPNFTITAIFKKHVAECVSMCSLHGICKPYENICECQGNFVGPACEVSTGLTQVGRSVGGFSSGLVWNYYSVQIATSSILVVNFTVSRYQGHDLSCSLYVNAETPPTLIDFDQSIEHKTTPGSYATYISYPTGPVWHFGVRGENCYYAIKFSLTNYCPNDCSNNGECMNKRCQCYPGQGGYDCSYSVNTLVPDTIVHSNLIGEDTWNYYEIDVERDTQSGIIYVNEINTRGRLWLFANFNKGETYFPTLYQWVISDMDKYDDMTVGPDGIVVTSFGETKEANELHTLQFRFDEPLQNYITVYIGVYTNPYIDFVDQNIPYDIVVHLVTL